jgi:hypothetical protein
VDIAWKDGKLAEAAIRPAAGSTGGPCKVRYGQKVVETTVAPGKPCRLDDSLNAK